MRKALISILLICAITIGSAFEIHHLATTNNNSNPQDQAAADKLKKNKEQLQAKFDAKCKGKKDLYSPTVKSTKDQVYNESSFSLFNDDKENFPQVSKELREGIEENNVAPILFNNFGTFASTSVMIWIVSLFLVLIAYIYCIYSICFVRSKRQAIKDNNKKIIAFVLVLLMAAIIYKAVVTFNSDSEETFMNNSDQADCVLLYNGLAFIENSDKDAFPGWGGVQPYQDKFTKIETFLTKEIKKSPFTDLNDAQAAKKITSPMDDAVAKIKAIKASKTTVTSPDPSAKKPENSDFLVGLNKIEASVEKDLGKSQSTAKSNGQLVSSIKDDVSAIVKDGSGIGEKITKAKKATIDYANAVSDFVLKFNSQIKSQQDDLDSYYYMTQLFFVWSKIVIVVAGVIGFLMLMFSNKIDNKNIGGNMMHFSWCYGTLFLMFYIVVIILYYVFGVAFQGGYCDPIAELQKDNTFLTKSWQKTDYPELQDIAQQCLNSKDKSLQKPFDIQAQSLTKNADKLDTDLKKFSTKTIAAPTDFSKLSGEDATCKKIEKDYSLALDSKGVKANKVLTDFSKYADWKKGDATMKTCKASQDEFTFGACPSGYTAWTSGSEAIAKPVKATCFQVNGKMPADLAKKRYVAANYKKCAAVKNNALGKTQDAILGKYSDSVGKFQNDVKTQIVGLCPKITDASKNINNDITQANKAQTDYGKKVTNAIKPLENDYITPVKGLQGGLDCSFINDKFLLQEQQAVCGYTESAIWDNYISFSIQGLLLAVFIAIIAFLTYRHFRLSTTTNILKSDFFASPERYNTSMSKQNIESQLGQFTQTPQRKFQNAMDAEEQNLEKQGQQFLDSEQQQAQQYLDQEKQQGQEYLDQQKQQVEQGLQGMLPN